MEASQLAKINQLVAEKIMGWTPKPCDLEETGREVIYYDDGYVECPCCKGYKHISEFEHGIIPPPCYSTDMNAAWLVFLHMMETYYPNRDEWRGHQYPIFRVFAEELMGIGGWDAVYGDEIYPSESFFTIVAKWNPENICKAALKAIGAL